jgi:hypothetical protein
MTLVSRPDSGFYYINGTLVAAEASLPGGSSLAPYDRLVFGVGRQRNQNFYQGRLDDVLIIGCNFSAQQVDSLYNAQTPILPLDSLPNDTVLCSGDSLFIQLNGLPNVSYFWDNGSTNSTRLITNPGTYTLRSINSTDTLLDTITIDFINPYVPSFIDTLICVGDSMIVDFNNFNLDSLVWSDGNTSYVRTFNGAQSLGFTTYSVCGSFSDSLNIEIQPTLQALNWDTISCASSLEIGFREDSTLTYNWSTGQSSRKITVNNTGIYTVQVSSACHTVMDSVMVMFPINPNLPLFTDTIICNGDSITVDCIRPSNPYGRLTQPAYTFPSY